MEKINLIVVDSNIGVTSSIKKYFEVSSDINVVKTLNNGEEALSYIINNESSIDVIIMDIVLPKMDGISLLHNLKSRKINKKTMILTSYYSDEVASKVTDIGVNFYMIKPFSLESLEDRIKDLYKESKRSNNKKANQELEISEILHNLGIPSHIRGYQYIRDGIIYLCNKKTYITYITKDVYPGIAKKYATTPSRVERAIRHAVEISWDRGDLELMEELFGHSINYERAKPTNSEFLNTIADRIKLKDRTTV